MPDTGPEDLVAEVLKPLSFVRENWTALFNRDGAHRTWTAMKSRTRYRVIDTIINFGVFAPLTILFWFGSWGVIDRLYMDNLPRGVGAVVVILVGGGIEFLVSYFQRYLASYAPADVEISRKYWLALTRFYNFMLGFANIMHYRGIMELWDMYIGLDMQGSLQATTTSTLLLWGLKCGRNILGPPLCCSVDTHINSKEFFGVSTYRRSQLDKAVEYMIDTALTVVVVTSLIDLHILGLGAVFDNLLFPDNVTLAIVSAWVIGYVISAFAISIEGAAKAVSKRLERRNNEIARLIFEDFYFLFCNIGVVLVWKGHWQFFDALSYYFPVYLQGYDITPFVANVGAFLLMTLCHASGTLVLKGCDIDGELRDGTGCELSIAFFSDFFSEKIDEATKKENEMQWKKVNEHKVATARAMFNNNKKSVIQEGSREYPAAQNPFAKKIN